jgi:hypothetical protein
MDPEMVIPSLTVNEPVIATFPSRFEEPDTLSEPDTTG